MFQICPKTYTLTGEGGDIPIAHLGATAMCFKLYLITRMSSSPFKGFALVTGAQYMQEVKVRKPKLEIAIKFIGKNVSYLAPSQCVFYEMQKVR